MINVGMLAKIRRIHWREGLSVREVARRAGLARNTIRHWLRHEGVVEPKYPARVTKSVVDPWADELRADRHRVKREQRTARMRYQAIRRQGYTGGYGRVCAFRAPLQIRGIRGPRAR